MTPSDLRVFESTNLKYTILGVLQRKATELKQ